MSRALSIFARLLWLIVLLAGTIVPSPVLAAQSKFYHSPALKYLPFPSNQIPEVLHQPIQIRWPAVHVPPRRPQSLLPMTTGITPTKPAGSFMNTRPPAM